MSARQVSRFSFLCSLTSPFRCRAHRFQHIYHFGIFGPIIRGRQDGPGPPPTFRRRLPGPWPAAWTLGGVELNCEPNVSYGFPFVASGCTVNDKPSYPRAKGMCTTVDGSGLCVQSWNPGASAINCLPSCVCACLVACRPCLEPAVPDEETNWCTKPRVGRGLLFHSLPVKELEFNKIGSTGQKSERCPSPAIPTFKTQSKRYRSGTLWRCSCEMLAELQLR